MPKIKINLRIVADDAAGISSALSYLASQALASNMYGAHPGGYEYDYDVVHSGNIFSDDTENTGDTTPERETNETR